ncbi:sugar transferase [Candidatus Uhrbacteria bacterium]|nr:sugar transferase [Candidatus Uhrbacteria bacterium]
MRKLDLFFATILVPLDYLALLLAATVAYSLRFTEFFEEIRPVIFALPFGEYLRVVSLIALGWIAIYAMSGLYTIGGRRKKFDEVKKIFLASTAAFGGELAVVVFSRDLFESRFILLVSWVLAMFFIGFYRLIFRLLRNTLYRLGFGLKRVVVVGKGFSAEALVEWLNANPKYGSKIVVHARSWDEAARKTVGELAMERALDQIIAVTKNGVTDELHQILDFADEYHVPFSYSADLISAHGAGLEFDTLAGVPLMELKRTRLEGWGRVYKRIFDIFGSLLLIMLTSPLMLLSALAVKFGSRGPLFFRHVRMGEGGQPFAYLKFRTMQPGTHEMRYKELAHLNIRQGPLVKFKDEDDPRITRAGRFLRKWSLDELPELFLVLTGKMSLVGPRPHHREEVDRYEKHHKKILTIKPGMTGLAQISGRADLSFDEEVRLDTYYMEHWSLKLDFIILLKTPFAVLGHKGTY